MKEVVIGYDGQKVAVVVVQVSYVQVFDVSFAAFISSVAEKGLDGA